MASDKVSIRVVDFFEHKIFPDGSRGGDCLILVDDDGVQIDVPEDPRNRHYREIQREVAKGKKAKRFDEIPVRPGKPEDPGNPKEVKLTSMEVDAEPLVKKKRTRKVVA